MAFRSPSGFSTAPQAFGFPGPVPKATPCLVPPSASPDGLAPVLREPARSGFGFAFVSLRSFASPSGSASLRRWSCFAALGVLRSPREAANPLRGFAFKVCSRRTQIGNLKSVVRCSIFKRDLSRAIKRQGWERYEPKGCRRPAVAGWLTVGSRTATHCGPRAARGEFKRTARRARLGVAGSIK